MRYSSRNGAKGSTYGARRAGLLQAAKPVRGLRELFSFADDCSFELSILAVYGSLFTANGMLEGVAHLVANGFRSVVDGCGQSGVLSRIKRLDFFDGHTRVGVRQANAFEGEKPGRFGDG